MGMRPDWTTSGKEAVLRTGLAKEQGEEYAAYIDDWLMPEMNGIEAIRRIRGIIGEDKPEIVLTAYDWPDIGKRRKMQTSRRFARSRSSYQSLEVC